MCREAGHRGRTGGGLRVSRERAGAMRALPPCSVARRHGGLVDHSTHDDPPHAVAAPQDLDAHGGERGGALRKSAGPRHAPSLEEKVITVEPIDDDSFSAAVAALMTTRGKLLIDSVDGVPALDSSRVGILAAMRFHSDGRALVYDGLPGPAPMRARPATLR